jgi:hypothetical protein
MSNTVSSVRSISAFMTTVEDDHRCSVDRENAVKIAM